MEILVSFVIFGILLIIGLAILLSLGLTNNLLFFAPCFGVCFFVVCGYVLSSIGLPITRGLASSLMVFSLLVALIFLLSHGRWRKVATHNFLPTIFVFFTFYSLFLIGINLFPGGTWLANGNDDFIMYVLGAQRFQSQGYFDVPVWDNVKPGSHYSWLLYDFFVKQHQRPGSEIFLALFGSGMTLDLPKYFMSILLALQATMVIAMLHFISNRGKFTVALLAILGFSPLILYSYFTQLIGQIGGIALSLCVIGILQIQNQLKLSQTLFTLSLTTTGLLLWYPEIATVLALSYGFFLLIHFKSRKQEVLRNLKNLMLCTPIIFLILNKYSMNVFSFVLKQLSGQSAIARDYVDKELFPFFLMPRGIAVSLGLLPLGVQENVLLENGILLFSILIYLTILFLILQNLRRSNLHEVMLLVLFSLGVYFAFHKQGFEAFKVALIMQPFLIIVVVNYLQKFKSSVGPRRYRVAITLTLIVLMVNSVKYTAQASDGILQYRKEFSGAQKGDLIENIKNLELSGKKALVFGANPIIAKLFMYYGTQDSRLFPDRAYDKLDNFKNFSTTSFGFGLTKKIVVSENVSINFTSFPNILRSKPFKLIRVNDPNVPIDRVWPHSEAWRVVDVTNAENVLTFVDSSIGHHYYLPGNSNISFYQAEPNPLLEGSLMNAVGEAMLLRVSNKTRNAMMTIDLTSSFIPTDDKKLPKITIYGKVKKVFELNTSGRALISFVPPEPLELDGSLYYVIQFLGSKVEFRNFSPGILGLWNKDIKLDNRKMTTFLSSISLSSPNQLKCESNPMELPQKTWFTLSRSCNLTFAGIYEDNWLSKNGFIDFRYFGKRESQNIATLLVRESGRIKISAFGQVGKLSSKEFTIQPGKRSFRSSWFPSGVTRVRIEWKTDRSVNPGGEDTREVFAQILRNT